MHLDIDIVNSIGTSLLPVSIFRLTTDVRYSLSGQIGLLVVFLFICGGGWGIMNGKAVEHSFLNIQILSTKIFSILLIMVLYT